jgi:DNA-binding transcriptional MerR regulator
MRYTVQKLAQLAGVTPRTLRFYDKAGLLSPAEVGANGYRYYGEEELLRLQQILFFRELDFPLADIKRMIDAPDFDHAEALAYQKKLLELKKNRIEGIIMTIDTTINAMTNDTRPTDKDIYGDLSTDEIDAMKNEARERWGGTEAYRQSRERAAKFTKQDWQRMREESESYMKELVALQEAGAAPESPEVQAQIARHHAGIERFYDCGPEIYAGLADMYVADPRFTAVYEKAGTGMADYLSKGMKHFAKSLNK